MPVAPYPARAALTWSRPAPDETAVKGRAAGSPGDWKYRGAGRSRAPLALAVFVSAALHLVMITGFNTRPSVREMAAAEEEPAIRLELPPLPPEEEDPPEEFAEQTEELPGVVVPMLADIPTRVPLASDFLQPMQLNVPVDPSLAATDLARVPVQIAHRPRGAGLKDLFDLAQLDRVPEPIAQPAPVFPFELRNQVARAYIVVEFVVTASGQVQFASVVSASHAGFERAAVEGVMRWRFRPGIRAGRKVNTRMQVPIVFKVVAEDT